LTDVGAWNGYGGEGGYDVKKVYRKPVLKRLGLLRYGLDGISEPDEIGDFED
jgi:hypothetical protein